MLKFHNITKTFNSELFSQPFTALSDVSFEVESGKVVGFLGANGAGKTTSLKIAMDFIRPTSGHVEFDKSLGKNKTDILSQIGFLPERPFFYPHLKGRDFCFFMGKLLNLSNKEISEKIKYWAPRFKIEFALDREINTYSKGMLQRIGFLVTLIHDPAFIILDESQNTTVEQMKMFLTRIGFNARAVITGDITQVDLPRGAKSGLRHAIEVLDDIPGISFNYFQSKDIVRHPVVARIVDAYDAFEQKEKRLKEAKKNHNANIAADKS